KWTLKEYVGECLTNGHFYFILQSSFHLKFKCQVENSLNSAKNAFQSFLNTFKCSINIDKLTSQEPLNIKNHLDLVENFMIFIALKLAPINNIISVLKRLQAPEIKDIPANHSLLLSNWILSVYIAVNKENYSLPEPSLVRATSDTNLIMSLLTYYMPSTSLSEGSNNKFPFISGVEKISKTSSKEYTSLIHNIQLFKKICSSHLTQTILCLSDDEILSSSNSYKVVIQAVFSEIFSIVEHEDECPSLNEKTMYYSTIHENTKENYSGSESESDKNEFEIPDILGCEANLTTQIVEKPLKINYETENIYSNNIDESKAGIFL
ncbi:hypothetical protein MXB_2992, partial [Myxobolus squamalis]